MSNKCEKKGCNNDRSCFHYCSEHHKEICMEGIVSHVDFSAAMQARIEKLTEYPARLQKAITELEAMAASPAFTEKTRILGKIEGVKLALSYFEEMTR